MSKIHKALKAVFLIMKKPVLLNRVLSEPDIWKDYIQKKYNLPDGLPQIRIGQLLGTDQTEIGPLTFLDGSSLPTDLVLLKGLAGLFTDCKYFEIGTWRGESVANIASIAKECYTLDLSSDELKRMGIKKESIEQHGFFSNDLENVIHLYGDSGCFDFTSLGKRFDLIFIDGDHHYDFVKKDTQQIFKHIVHEHSVVVWHDYVYHPEKIRFEVLAAILDGTDPKLHSGIFYVAHTKCAVYIDKDFETSVFKSPVKPEEYYELLIRRREITG